MKSSKLIAMAALLMSLSVTAAPARAADDTRGSWRPSILEKKEPKPLPDDLSKVKDKQWLTIAYPEYPGGFKPRLGVVFSEVQEQQANLPPVENEYLRVLMALSGDQNKAPDASPLGHLEDIVRQALGNTGRFTMLERTTAKADVLEEQDFGAGGRVDRKTAAAIGHMKGADFVVKATVIEINPEKESKEITGIGGGIGGGGFGIASVGLSGKVAFCRLNVRLVNATTGDIVQDMTVDGTSSSSGVKVGGGLLGSVTGGLVGGGAGVDSKKAASIADAIQACANKVSYHLAMKLDDLPWEGLVAKADPLMINAGTNIGLRAGLELKLLSKGEMVRDPEDSTVVLGYVMEPIGTARITDAQEKYATCEILEGGEGLKKGDVVRLEPRRN